MEHKLFKKLFSMLLVVAMVLSMCPTFVFAEGADGQSVVDYDPDGNGCPHCEGPVEWKAWNATNVAAGGHYRLTSSFTLSSQITIAAGADTVIDLAGFTITGKYPTTIATNSASASMRLCDTGPPSPSKLPMFHQAA